MSSSSRMHSEGNSSLYRSLAGPKAQPKLKRILTQSYMVLEENNVIVLFGANGNHRISVRSWSAETTEELISTHGRNVLRFLTDKGIPLLCDAILNRQFDSAEILLEYARDCDAFVLIDTGKCPTLDYVAVKGSVAITKFVLDRVAAKQFTVDETLNILTNYLLPLTQTFPGLMRNYLEKDAFSFEYGRVWVPPSLFNHPRRPVAMTTNEKLRDWTSMDSTAIKEFWSRNCEEHRTKFAKTSGVEAIAKCLCVNQHAVRQNWSDETVSATSDFCERRSRYHFLRFLSNRRGLPVEVFNSESLQIFTTWVFNSVIVRFVLFVVSECAVMGGFWGFAWSRKALQDGDYLPQSVRQRRTIFLFLLLTAQIFGRAIKRSWIYFPSIAILLCLIICYMKSPNTTEFTAILTSIECILIFVIIIVSSLPLENGWFSSMISYSFFSVGALVVTCFSLLYGFAAAIRVLSIPSFYKSKDDGGGDFGSYSILRSWLTIFYACFGNFDAEAISSTKGVVGLWRAVVYILCTLFGGVILINLLIAIMGDAYDRFKLNERADSIRHRAAIAGDVVSSVAYRSVTSEDEYCVCFGWRAILRLMSAGTSRFRSCFYRGKVRQRVSGKYFHYLVPVKETGGEESEKWQGKIREIEKSLKREVQREIQDAAQRTQASVDRCSELIEMLADKTKQTESSDAAMKDQMQATLSLILKKLDQDQT